MSSYIFIHFKLIKWLGQFFFLPRAESCIGYWKYLGIHGNKALCPLVVAVIKQWLLLGGEFIKMQTTRLETEDMEGKVQVFMFEKRSTGDSLVDGFQKLIKEMHAYTFIT